MKLIKTAFALLSLALLTACGDPESDFEEAINASIGESGQCWMVPLGMSNEFPLKVSPDMFSNEPAPMLSALEENGMISIEKKRDDLLFAEYFEVTLTDRGQEAGVWHPQNGFCIGRREVQEIIRYTYADQGANENAASVTYTWKLADIPDWLERDLFDEIIGMTDPVERTATVQKSSDGWHMVGW